MTIVQLELFDLLTANTAQVMGATGFWANLSRLTREHGGGARLLMVADNLKPEEVVERFRRQAIPMTHLPIPLRMYRLQYENFLLNSLQVTRHMRLYLVVNTSLTEAGLARLLGSYGIRARVLEGEGVPLPFIRGTVEWTKVTDEQGYQWGMVQSKPQQGGVIHARTLHSLFAQSFPVWAALDIVTYTPAEARKLLRRKDESARYENSPATEAQQEAQEVRHTVAQMLSEIARIGASLHQVRLSVVAGGESERELDERLELVRSSAGLEMEEYRARAQGIRDLFDTTPAGTMTGALLPSHGLALLAGSAMSYRRRTETNGIFLGVDRNQSPVIVDIFDHRNESYSTVVLGRSGSGKTFFILLLMLRHLLRGVRLVIIDPQGNIDLSWLGTELYAKAVLGTTESSINILDITHEELAQQINSVMAMLAMLQVLDRENRLEVGLIDQILMDIYLPLWGRVLPHQVPTLRAVQERLAFSAEDPAVGEDIRAAARRLHFALDQYTGGSRYELFGQPTKVDFRLDHAVTVFDVSKLPQRGEKHDNLRAALLAILVGNINQSIRRKRRVENDWTPMLLLVDEMGILMRDAVIASHISAEFKTARARHVGVVLIDQDLHSALGPADETGLHHGVPMLANRANTFIFNQLSSEFTRIREQFPTLPEAIVQTLPNLGQGSCVAEIGKDLLFLDVIASPLEQTALSSKATDRDRMRRLIEQLIAEHRALASATPR
jgi:hypothetical protein